MEAKAQGRVLAWLALFVALVTSVAANVAFAQPHAGPRLSSSVAPILVILAAGLLERVPLVGVQWWRRLLAYLGLGVVIGAAFVTSFEHQFALLVRYGNSRLSAALLPIAVDGLIVLASVCLTVIAERRAAQAFAPRVRDAQPPTQVGGNGATSNDPPLFVVPAQPALTFAPEPAAQPTADAAQDPTPRPLRARSVARPHPRATRNAQPDNPLREQVLALHAQMGQPSAAKIVEAMNGEAPPLRTVQLWISQARNAQQEGASSKEKR